MHDMSLTEIYFFIGVVWSFVKIAVSGTELVTKKASKSLNFPAKVWRQAEIEEVYRCLNELPGPGTRIVAVSIGFFIAALSSMTAWPISVYLFLRERT